jgi:beta-glucosidase
VTLANTGEREGKQVVQVYAERADSTVDRPARWLVGFAVVHAEPGRTVTAAVPVPARRLAHWAGEWLVEPGAYTLRVGSSVADLPLSVEWVQG